MSAESSPPPTIVAGKENKKDAGSVEMSLRPAHAAAEQGEVVDAVWGRLDENSPNYRNLGWVRAAIIEIKSQIGLGILGLPLVMNTIGLVPGIIVILVIAIIITWSDYVIGKFKLAHPEVYTLADVGYLMGGRVGKEVIGFMYWIEMVAIAGAGMIGVSTALNAVSIHGTCTVVFVVVAAIATAIISSIRTLDRISWIGWVGLVSILAAVITLTASVAVQDRPSLAPQSGPWVKEVNAFTSASFVDAMNAVSTVVFAYAGTPAFISVCGEMRNQQDYNKSIITCQAFVSAVYLIIGAVVYHYVGQYIASPALGSAGPLMKRVCYGLAIPGLLVGCIIYLHLPAKAIFVRLLRNSKHLSQSTWQHWTIWLSCVIGNTIIAFVIAESIPVFGDLLSLIGALLGTFICIILEAYMWIWLERGSARTTRWKWLVAMNAIFIAIGFFIMVAGTYAAAITINDSLQKGTTTSPFTCADNSNSV